MNVVLRITTNIRSFILKQSRPYVQKYQQIEAPLERIEVEYQFYSTVQGNQIDAHIPNILAYDKMEFSLMMEDLGQCKDMTYLYGNRTIKRTHLDRLIHVLQAIHKSKPEGFPKNMELRKLNHQHIFVLPFMEDNGFQLDDIQEGLQELSLTYKGDTVLKSVVETLGVKYLSEGSTLIHGDYYPGSWITEDDNIYIIDPEFSFLGFAEFDLGVMAAHLIMATSDSSYLDFVLKKYQGCIDKKWVHQIVGIEIMRRLIGLAQLPLERTLQEKEYLLQMARKMILE
ncbi:MAG: phosphotransferase [Maribacter sp.]|nr:phosphotransferase [Maribacter sp.]